VSSRFATGLIFMVRGLRGHTTSYSVELIFGTSIKQQNPHPSLSRNLIC
jgi:hypothetical protein